VRLACALSDAGGSHNEDACGHIDRHGTVEAAWVIDGVTGINDRNILPAATDALWFVERVQTHLQTLAARPLPLREVLAQLTASLISDWADVSRQLNVPAAYDLPACCLLLVRKSENGWQALRLGDSFLLTQQNGALQHHVIPPSNLHALDLEQKMEAQRLRAAGNFDFTSMLAQFRPRMLANRKSRNLPGGVSVLEPTPLSLNIPQYIDLGHPTDILLCTDGFYRCVDHYHMHTDQSLFTACGDQQGAHDVLHAMRNIETSDRECRTYLRFKPQDDATVLKLSVSPDTTRESVVTGTRGDVKMAVALAHAMEKRNAVCALMQMHQ
jgi:Protein phosphatase 2C